MARKPANSPIFGLRYLEEEDLEINDIVGCQVAAIPSPKANDYVTFDATYYTTYTDVPDTDDRNDPGEIP